MKLLLTSDGLSTQNLKNFFISILPKESHDCSLLLIYYKLYEEPELYEKYKKEEIKNIGITNVTSFDMHEEKFTNTNCKYDIIWVCGGNTFAILDRMKKTGVFDFIKKSATENNSLYLGVSAGSIIAGKNIKVANEKIGDYDENIIKLKDLSGLNFTNISVFPHFEKYMQEELDKLKKKVDYKIIEITDEEGVFVDNNGYKIIR